MRGKPQTEARMKYGFSPFLAHLENLFLHEEGQDLVEYALVVALIALAATAGMNTLASDISAAFTSVGDTFTANL